jgi:hypothetical protein
VIYKPALSTLVKAGSKDKQRNRLQLTARLLTERTFRLAFNEIDEDKGTQKKKITPQ